ncbi:3-dehydroquinate synthase [Streptoalloteichus tenebrarius]|uniref:2-deoxy-scyllo-inosose synthase n=2 Tax=Streptoalloteichus tenebrarius (strain ATCC 17920 / DSM 40477 / JCM 4838 / CBS 697.72 / NBRC 16177 / NCIMB 11028 / NRRL B-12390 / A12253. 1 / ISP 5477) TaxID=1933 RepID=DOIS_STRSD|nr:2-deoxy-scyllo-inosose synthase [Streptoalloteichus tenebrarius]Q2MF16.1 RecName: Full=2-deoxy-scyllo-inosose synthase; Short=DOI synthase; Short=DOIS [Streptoalloteichus tenebrarius]MCP2261255.1 3-dehydroquinate synthase [Streptoalloteichus tenebrarius]CAE22471.1 2-deoxy-scyllo-inosose synthase [Streptoalloteichus tenebrarius]CAH18556.1 putative 2-deoxy-scyllo-inosose synthase, TobC [Streptoalloteichus tenebrarius]BFF04447.1 3-dehydroquinate synthase [Streptoalloteichus tenebrarius]
MQTTTITMGDVQYPYRLGTGCVDGIVTRLGELEASHYLVLCDATVAELYGHDLAARLRRSAGPASVLTHPAGEEHKGLGTLDTLADAALHAGVDRRGVVVALGGGVTGNIAGLLAALLFRGIRLVHVPTTVVAMLDSVLSLKQAVNAQVGKNLVGTFYPPVEVLADTAMLGTLPVREIRSGLCEVVKNALAIRPSMIDFLAAELRPDGRYADDVLRWMIDESVAAKAQVTEHDKYERREGLVLEYGHTVGHALEHASHGAVSHGAGVGVGMVAAAEVARRLGHVDADLVELHRELVGKVGVATTLPADVPTEEITYRLGFDNKRGYQPLPADHYAMVLLADVGQPLYQDGLPLTPAPRALVDEVVRELADAPSRIGASVGSAGGAS